MQRSTVELQSHKIITLAYSYIEMKASFSERLEEHPANNRCSKSFCHFVELKRVKRFERRADALVAHFEMRLDIEAAFLPS